MKYIHRLIDRTAFCWSRRPECRSHVHRILMQEYQYQARYHIRPFNPAWLRRQERQEADIMLARTRAGKRGASPVEIEKNIRRLTRIANSIEVMRRMAR